MQHDYRLVYNFASNAIVLELPADMIPVTRGNITAKSTAGTELLAATAVTVPTASTISADAEIGDDTITVTAGTYEPGERWQIADSDDGPEEVIEVESFDSSTKVISLRSDLQHSHASGAAISGGWVSYTLDTTTTTTWANLTEGKLIFDTWDTGAAALDRTFVVSKKAFSFGAIEERFEKGYSHYYVVLEGDDVFDEYAEEAIEELTSRFEKYGKAFQSAAGEVDVIGLIMAKIAHLIAERQGATWEDERLSMQTAVDRKFNLLRETRQWYDADEDDIQEEGETEIQSVPLPRRLWS